MKRPAPTASTAAPLWRIWTDGACEPNPGVGGWGFKAIGPDGIVIERFGGNRKTTNNRMELTAILEGLRSLPSGASATVHSDSTYAVNGINKWHHGWRRKGWKRGSRQIPNADLWILLSEQCNRLKVTMYWVRSHNGDPGNERADSLASKGRLSVLA